MRPNKRVPLLTGNSAIQLSSARTSTALNGIVFSRLRCKTCASRCAPCAEPGLHSHGHIDAGPRHRRQHCNLHSGSCRLAEAARIPRSDRLVQLSLPRPHDSVRSGSFSPLRLQERHPTAMNDLADALISCNRSGENEPERTLSWGRGSDVGPGDRIAVFERLSKTARTRVKIAVLPPMPRASVNMP